MRKLLPLVSGAALALVAGAATPTVPSSATNPFLCEWTTPFGVPPFAEIKDEHFLPAYAAAMEGQRAAVAAIVANPEPPTFANTIEALDRSGDLLAKVDAVFSNLSGADTNPGRQAIDKEMAPRKAALRDDIVLDPRLFARVKSVWSRRAGLGLSPVELRLVEETYRGFTRGGANLTPEQQARFRAINQEQAALAVKFTDNVLAETNGYRLTIDNPADLAGLPERVVQGAAEAAKRAGLGGKWVFTLHWPSLWPFLENADNRALRQQILSAYLTRGAHADAADNRKILARMAALRAERAALLGFATHADYVLDERMAKTPAQVLALLDQVWAPARAKAVKEAGELQALIDADRGGFRLTPADWRYYTTKLRRTRFDFDDEAVRAYFPLERVRQGAFEVAHRLYGLTFMPRADLPVHHHEVEAFEVKDADGSHLGVFYTDFFPRPGKRGGAWSSGFRGTWRTADGREVRPVVANTCNFSRPAGGAPALLSIDEVETLFHEFGHALHSLLSRVPYRSLAGVPRDFVELPSQVMENWAFEPAVLELYARHWRTGEAIPAALVAKLRAAKEFNQGFETVEYTAAAYLDMAWHSLSRPEEPDAADFERAALEKAGLIPEIEVRYRSPYFTHIFGGAFNYSAGYYSYLWSAVLDSDAFEAFKEKGLFDAATARAFRTEVLERGNTVDAAEMYRRFRGRDPRVEPLLVRRGLR